MEAYVSVKKRQKKKRKWIQLNFFHHFFKLYLEHITKVSGRAGQFSRLGPLTKYVRCLYWVK